MFDVKKEKDKIVEFIRNYFLEQNLGGVVIGISGGKDSGVVAGLFTEAIGAENVLGVMLPCHSNMDDQNDAYLVSKKFGFQMITLDLTNTYDTFHKEIDQLGSYTTEELKNSDINLKPRLRMASLYYLAALYSSLKHKTYVVAGTGNQCEIFVGYFTKGGDGVSDINVLANLTVEEVIQIGEELGVPKEVLYKIPSDGLSGISDEEKLGVSYQDISKVIRGEKVDPAIGKKIESLHNKSLHKFHIPTYEK